MDAVMNLVKKPVTWGVVATVVSTVVLGLTHLATLGVGGLTVLGLLDQFGVVKLPRFFG
jgi:hypothetical protein